MTMQISIFNPSPDVTEETTRFAEATTIWLEEELRNGGSDWSIGERLSVANLFFSSPGVSLLRTLITFHNSSCFKSVPLTLAACSTMLVDLSNAVEGLIQRQPVVRRPRCGIIFDEAGGNDRLDATVDAINNLRELGCEVAFLGSPSIVLATGLLDHRRLRQIDITIHGRQKPRAAGSESTLIIRECGSVFLNNRGLPVANIFKADRSRMLP